MRDGWVETTLGEILTDCKNGKNYREDDESRGLPITRIQTISEGEINLNKVGYGNLNESNSGDFLLTNGDILFSHINSLPHVGKVAFVNSEVLPLIHGMNLLRMKFNNSCDPKFMFFTMQHDATREKVRAIAQRAVNQVSVTISKIKSIQIILPPLAEQKRIVDLISSVDSYIEALQQQVDKARKSRNAVLHELLTKDGDGWVETKLGEICEIYQPKTIAKSLMNDSGNYIVYGANGPIGRFDEYNHENSEVVVTCRGATCGTVNKTPQKTWITGNAMVIKPKNDSLLRDFLFFSLTSYVDLKSCISGSAQPQITREGISPQKILIPPLAEQKRIVEIISVFDNQIKALDSTIAKTKNLRSALLSDLLSGNHEIPTTYDKLIGAA